MMRYAESGSVSVSAAATSPPPTAEELWSSWSTTRVLPAFKAARLLGAVPESFECLSRPLRRHDSSLPRRSPLTDSTVARPCHSWSSLTAGATPHINAQASLAQSYSTVRRGLTRFLLPSEAVETFQQSASPVDGT